MGVGRSNAFGTGGLNKYRIYAARHFARVNRLNKVMVDNENARLGITTGKAYLDVMPQALEDLGYRRQTRR